MYFAVYLRVFWSQKPGLRAFEVTHVQETYADLRLAGEAPLRFAFGALQRAEPGGPGRCRCSAAFEETTLAAVRAYRLARLAPTTDACFTAEAMRDEDRCDGETPDGRDCPARCPFFRAGGRVPDLVPPIPATRAIWIGSKAAQIAYLICT